MPLKMYNIWITDINSSFISHIKEMHWCWLTFSQQTVTFLHYYSLTCQQTLYMAHIQKISLHYRLFWILRRKMTPPWRCTHINPATTLTVIIIQDLVWRLHGCVYMDWQQHWEASTAGRQQTHSVIRGRLVGQAWCKDAEWLSYCHTGVPYL